MTTANQNDDKYTYCPEYDSFFNDSKQKLEQRLINHLHLREPWIKKAVENTITEIESLGYKTYIDAMISDYNLSFINYQEINKLINEWHGPLISDKYKQKFNDSDDETTEIDANKFNKDAVNWLDQSSYKVTGKYFFAVHIVNIKSHLQSYCNSIANIPETQRINILNYGCIYFAFQLLSTKTKFKRSKKQPLIRNKTLVNSKELHEAFAVLYNKLNLVELKKIVKKNNKYKPKKEKGNKYRIDSNLFTKNLMIYCTNLLNQEKVKLGLISISNINGGDIIPVYFQDLQAKQQNGTPSTMDIDTNNKNTDNSLTTNNSTNYTISTPPKPTPPPRPPLPSSLLIPKQDVNDNNNSCSDCCCTSTPNHNTNYQYQQPPRTVFIPYPVPFIPTNDNRYPMYPNNGLYNYYPHESYRYYSNGYKSEHGGNHIGSAAQFRYNPYNKPFQHDMPPPIPMESPLVPMPAMNSKFCIESEHSNFENVSTSSDTASSLSHSAQSLHFTNSVESPYNAYYGNPNQSNY